MFRILKTSGFLGLATMMVVGLSQNLLLESVGAVPPWLIGGHAHLDVLSILAVVLGFAVDAFALSGTLRTTVTGLFVVGQWFLPLTIWLGQGFDRLDADDVPLGGSVSSSRCSSWHGRPRRRGSSQANNHQPQHLPTINASHVSITLDNRYRRSPGRRYKDL